MNDIQIKASLAYVSRLCISVLILAPAISVAAPETNKPPANTGQLKLLSPASQISSTYLATNQKPSTPPPIATIQVFPSEQDALTQKFPALSSTDGTFNERNASTSELSVSNSPPTPPSPANYLASAPKRNSNARTTARQKPSTLPPPITFPSAGIAQSPAWEMPPEPLNGGDNSKALGVGSVGSGAVGVATQLQATIAPAQMVFANGKGQSGTTKMKVMQMPTNDSGQSISPEVIFVKLKAPKKPSPYFPED